MEVKLVKVSHITYYNVKKEKTYTFITFDDVKKGDIVLCDTRYGVTLGSVREVCESITADELLALRNRSNISFLRECKLLPDYKNIKLEEESEDLPF